MRIIFIAAVALAVQLLISPSFGQQSQQQRQNTKQVSGQPVQYRPPAPAKPIAGMTYAKCYTKSTDDGYSPSEASRHCGSRYKN